MSNLINNILPNENVATPSATTSSEQTVKDKPSLFDSLLTNAGTPEETKVTSDIKQEIKEVKTEEIVALNSEEIKVDDSEIKKEQLDLTKKVEEVDSQGQKLAGTGSLLDRLILEAKTNAKEIVNADNQKINDLNNKIDNSNILKQEIKPEEIPAVNAEEVKLEDSEIKKEQLVVTKKVEEVDTKEQKNTEVSSLLDRLILEVKTDTKEVVNKEVVTTNLSDTSEQTIENKPSLFDSLLKNNVVTEEIKVTTDVKQEPKEVKTEEILVVNIEEVKTEKATNNLTEKIDIESKNSVVEVVLNNEVVNKKLEIKKVDEIVNSNSVVEVIEDISLIENLSTGTDKVIVVDNIVKKELMDSPVDSNIQLVEEPENINLKINNESILPSEVIEKTDINVLEKTDAKKDVKISLMDQLIQKNSEKLVADSTNEIGENINTSSKDGLSKDLISNIYLGSQKNKINNQTLFNKNEAISLLKDGNSIQAVKASAEILDLGLQSVSIEKDIDLENIDVKKSNIDLLNKKNLIDNLLLKNDIRGEEVKDLITKSVEASKALIDNTLTVADDAIVNVNSPLSYNIQSRIIGAKQQMSAMMSDIAKQMYENYKPPVTAFKINLNPLDLGSIAILMKNDKNNGLTITMNVSNNVTLETLIENQNVLKNSLNKTFDENTKFNLDFSSSNQNNSNQSSNNEQRNSRQFEQQMDTKSILELQEENKDREEKVIDYM
jgi:hypothetical protein